MSDYKLPTVKSILENDGKRSTEMLTDVKGNKNTLKMLINFVKEENISADALWRLIDFTNTKERIKNRVVSV